MSLHLISYLANLGESSTTIEKTTTYCVSQEDHFLAYIYFTFNDAKTQSTMTMLRSILRQLVEQRTKVPVSLFDLAKNNQPTGREPSLLEWTMALQSVLEMRGHSFILINALDECPTANNERQVLLGLLKTIHGFGLSNVHVLATSRKEHDIEKALASIVSVPPIGIQTSDVDADVRTYVRKHLMTDPMLKNWPRSIQNEIEEKLVKGSFGM